MENQVEMYLQQELEKLERAYKKILETQSYTKECENIRLLQEMIKEQVLHENPRPTTR